MLTVALLVALASAAFLLWPSPRPSQERLSLLVGRRLEPTGRSVAERLPVKSRERWRTFRFLKDIERIFTQWDLLARFALYLQQAGLSLRLIEALILAGLAVAVATISGVYLKGSAGGVIAGAAAALALWRGLERRRSRRLLRFEEQLPEAITTAVQQLRAGRTLPVAIAYLGERFPPPLGEEFRKCEMELEVGIPLEEVLSSLRERIPSRILRMTTVAISVTNKMGGNLAEFLEAQGETLRLQIAYHRQVRVLTAQARISTLVVGFLPGFVAGVFLILQPGFFKPLLVDPLGRFLLLMAAGLQGVGVLTIRTMMRRIQ
jgi:tight adherence protein B